MASGFDTRLVQRYRIDAANGWVAVDQYRLEMEYFADCVAAGSRPRTDGSEVVANMRVIDALADSAAAGRPVDVE